MERSLFADVLTDYDAASGREWLVTNGIGGYASASLAGANTRRYHGLLVAAVEPPNARTVVLSRCEETVSAGGKTWQLGANQFPGTISPEGYRLLERFDIDPAPTFFYRLKPSLSVRKRVWMGRGMNTTYVEYTPVQSANRVELVVSPLVCWKGYHTEMRRRDGFPAATAHCDNGILMLLDHCAHPLRLTMEGAEWEPRPCWYYNFEHQRERERGFDWIEDLYCPGAFRVQLREGESAALIATIGARPVPSPETSWSTHVAHRARLTSLAAPRDETETALTFASDAFVIDRIECRPVRWSTVIAGYPWFQDWGRDTMIALRGLCLETGRLAVARDVLLSYADHLHDGLIPNRFSENGAAPEYNTADATLWFVEAVRAYCERADDVAEVARALWPALTAIIARHLAGTGADIRADASDGLLRAGGPDTQVTWMDARVDGHPVTPRAGKPVEINALWYSALRTIAGLAPEAGADGAIYARLAERAGRSFPAAFARIDGLGLWDVIRDDGSPDPAIRPNQIIAAALHHTPLKPAQRKAVVDVVERELLTPRGLRTLAPEDPAYCGRYAGSPSERDGAYHQGTVWPWLLGPFVEAHLAVYGDRKRARAFLEPLQDHLLEAGMGTVSEVFDGDAPHRPGGCIAQAWSVAEMLRAWRLTGAG